MPHDLADDLRPPAVEAAPRARRRRHARRIAPLATAIGVIIAATIGLVLARIDVPASNPSTVPVVTTTH
ncbi:MAG TPA: hypothetical protein VHZ97_07100 [Pseudonocardiaceae bacterium]|nr:hypothetical protein [Pseudonocardiaceae bacterium]